MAGVSKAAFGRLMDVRPQTVTQYAKAGWLVFDADGLVDADLSKARVEQLKDPTRGGRNRSGPKPAKSTKARPTPRRWALADRKPSDPAGAAGNAPRETFEDVRKRQAEQMIELNAIKLAQARGDLIGKAGVLRASYECATAARDRVLQIPNRLASRVAAETDVGKCHAMLTQIAEEICMEISDACGALADSLNKPAESTGATR